MENPTCHPLPRGSKKKEMTDSERIQVVSMLLGMSEFGGLPYGAIGIVAKKFQISRDTVSRLWKRATLSRSQGKVVHHEIISLKSNRGRQVKWDIEAVLAEVKKLPRKKRKNIRALANRLGIPFTTIQHMKKQKKVLVRRSARLKPQLNDDHLIARIDYALAQRDPVDKTKYCDMYDRVHVDEKWFYMSDDGECYILAHDEEPPKRTTKHKGYITKVMFLCAMARPRLIRGKWWDGKIGIWPVGRFKPAERASKNRPAGAMVWENETVDRDKYREIMIDNVLPAILAKFPTAYLERHGVRIQQDGARCHIDEDDQEWLDAVAASGCMISLYKQPAQSPDLNLNDLAFFRSIQSLYYEAAPETEMDLIDAVEDAFEQYPINKINRMWLTLQSCCNKILEHDGGNHYKIEHMDKEKLEREGRLPTVLSVSQAACKFDPTHPQNH